MKRRLVGGEAKGRSRPDDNETYRHLILYSRCNQKPLMSLNRIATLSDLSKVKLIHFKPSMKDLAQENSRTWYRRAGSSYCASCVC